MKLPNKKIIYILIICLVIGLSIAIIPQIVTNKSLWELIFQQDQSQATLRPITAKALDDHGCNTEEWHFVINQVDTQSHAPATILVEWANGAKVAVSLEKFTGGTAHYTNKSNLNSKVVSATTQIYASWSGQFNLSHGPCGSNSATPTPSASSVPSGTPRPSITTSPGTTRSPSPTPTRSPSPTPTASPTASPSGTPPVGGPSNTPTPTASPTNTPAPSATSTPQPSTTSTPVVAQSTATPQPDNSAVAAGTDEQLPKVGTESTIVIYAFAGISLTSGVILLLKKKKYY
ncbi:MAG: hypothetical protein M3Q44_00255 [bacterium]|nr:hypothetical protein [bacterium]